MKLLNADTSPKVRCTGGAKPELFEFTVRDRRFVYDCNSMVLAQLEPGENPKNHPPDLVLGVEYRPVFPCYRLSSCRYLVIEACHACNLRCDYCLVRAYYPGVDMMSFDTARSAIDYLFPNVEAAKGGSIGFFGGEPLLNWRTIVDVVRYFEGRTFPAQPHFHITTNGTLFSKDKLAFLRGRRFSGGKA
jgi:sulfatase maturation enzyme AslB (radical SAM superfamily)